jgi:tetratricopeptide (TPR) repeat protein
MNENPIINQEIGGIGLSPWYQEGTTYFMMAKSDELIGKYETAARLYSLSIAVLEGSKEDIYRPELKAKLLIDRALCYRMLNRYTSASNDLNSALRVLSKTDVGETRVEIYIGWADIHRTGERNKEEKFKGGDLFAADLYQAKANRLLLEKLQSSENYILSTTEVRCNIHAGLLSDTHGNFKESISYYEKAISQARKLLESMPGVVEYQRLYGRALSVSYDAYVNTNNIAKAKTFVECGLDLLKKIGDSRGETNALYGLGKIYEAQELWYLAGYFYQQSMHCSKSNSSTPDEAYIVAKNAFEKVVKKELSIEPKGNADEQMLNLVLSKAHTHDLLQDHLRETDYQAIALDLFNLAQSYESKKLFATARDMYGQALTFAQHGQLNYFNPQIFNIIFHAYSCSLTPSHNSL